MSERETVAQRARGRGIGYRIGNFVLAFSWCWSDLVVGLRFTDDYFGLCAGPFTLGVHVLR